MSDLPTAGTRNLRNGGMSSVHFSMQETAVGQEKAEDGARVDGEGAYGREVGQEKVKGALTGEL